MVPPQLTTTALLLQRAFPHGKLDDDEYSAVLEILYPHMADENLVIVVADLTGRDAGLVQNDVYRAGSAERPSVARDRVARLLNDAGFDEWVNDAG